MSVSMREQAPIDLSHQMADDRSLQFGETSHPAVITNGDDRQASAERRPIRAKRLVDE